MGLTGQWRRLRLYRHRRRMSLLSGERMTIRLRYLTCECRGTPFAKQQLAAVRMLFDWLITGQVVTGKPGVGRARPEARREDRQDTGARCRRLAQAARHHSDRVIISALGGIALAQAKL
jgi:hypothetical protein